MDGISLSAKVHVKVIPCPTNDSLLDNPVVRKGLDSLWKLAWPDTTNLSNRIERAGNVYRDSAGNIGFQIIPLDTTNDACTSRVDNPPPGTTLLRQVHVHPGRVGSVIRCKGEDITINSQFGRPSTGDWRNAQTAAEIFGSNVRGWIIDQDDIVEFDPNGVTFKTIQTVKGPREIPQNWEGKVKYVPRRANGCTVV